MSTQKLIIFQTGIIKLCIKHKVVESSKKNEEPKNINVDKLEERVTKIENFLKASNFVEKDAKLKFAINQNKNEVKQKKAKPPKPKYEGKTQDYWPKLVNDFKEEGKMFMYINLAGTVAKEINDMTVAIEFPNGMSEVAKEFLERPDNKMNLRNIISTVSGKDMQIKFIDTKPEKIKNEESEFESFANQNDLPFKVI